MHFMFSYIGSVERLLFVVTENGACSVHAKRSQEGTRAAATSKNCSFWLQLSDFCKSFYNIYNLQYL